MNNEVIAIFLAGVIACLAMDGWQQILKRITGIPATGGPWWDDGLFLL